MIVSKIKTYRGDTAYIPLLVTIPEDVTVRVHLRQYAESDIFYALEITTLPSDDKVIVLTSDISGSISGHYELDVEFTDIEGVVSTVQHTDVDIISDITRTSGTIGETLPSDLERNKIIATEFWLRLPNNNIVKVNLDTATLGEMSANNVVFTATATIESIDVQSALEEIDNKKADTNEVESYINGLTCTSMLPVTPNDSNLLAKEGFIQVRGNAGNVRVLTSAGDDVVLQLEAKEIIPLYIKKVFTTGTTATNIYLFTN